MKKTPVLRVRKNCPFHKMNEGVGGGSYRLVLIIHCNHVHNIGPSAYHSSSFGIYHHQNVVSSDTNNHTFNHILAEGLHMHVTWLNIIVM